MNYEVFLFRLKNIKSYISMMNLNIYCNLRVIILNV
jgi:hypothetical protein